MSKRFRILERRVILGEVSLSVGVRYEPQVMGLFGWKNATDGMTYRSKEEAIEQINLRYNFKPETRVVFDTSGEISP